MATFIHIDDVAIHSLDEETYTKEEKKLILEKLNAERRRKQSEEKSIAKKVKEFMKMDAKDVYDQINTKFLSDDKREKIKLQRTENKKVYRFGAKEFYKFLDMERTYYIEVSGCMKISSRPGIYTLYYKTLDELIKKDVLIKTESYSNKFYISHNAMRVFYRPYRLEDHK